MKADIAALALGILVVMAFVAGRLVAYLGILPHVGYIITGMLFGAGLPQEGRGYLFAYALGFLLAYLGYMASSRRIFSAPLQLFFVHPLRLAVGFTLFFTFFYILGLPIPSAAVAGLLLSTSSALVVRWGRGTSYSLIEQSILSMDALVSAIALLFVAEGSFGSIAITVGTYLLLILSGGPITSVLIFLIAAILAAKGYLGYLSLSFITGIVLHHLIYDLKMHWAEGAMQEVLPIVFLVGIGAWAGLAFTPTAGLVLVVVAFLSVLQNFISLVILGPVFGVSPKTGAHILARTLGPSEAAIFALAILGGRSDISLAVLWFYTLSLIFSSYVRNERDAEHLLSALMPKSIFQSIERLEQAYASLFIRHHVVFSSAYRHKMLGTSRKLLTAMLLLITSVSALAYLAESQGIPHRVAWIFLTVTVVVLSLLKMLQYYTGFYDKTIEFISEHAYSGKLRPGRSPYYLVSGFILTVSGFILTAASISFFNLILLFFALMILNVGLYVLLSSYAKIYNEFVKKKVY